MRLPAGTASLWPGSSAVNSTAYKVFQMIYEIYFTAPQQLDDALSALLSEAGSMGVVLEDTGQKSIFSASDTFEHCRYKGYFDETINRRAVELAIRFLLINHGERDTEIHWTALEDQDWRESWKRHFKPLLIGKQLLVLPSWLQPPENAQERTIIRIDPEMAFGSGTHETTWGCLESLEILAEKKPLGRVLDMGTGSGILLIGAMLLGAESGLGVDRDPIAVETCARNCRTNLAEMAGFETRLDFRLEDQLPSGLFDTVVANILAPVLTGFLSQTKIQFQHCVAPGGHLLLSGILTEQATEIEKTACQNGFVTVGQRDIGAWSVLVMQRKDGV